MGLVVAFGLLLSGEVGEQEACLLYWPMMAEQLYVLYASLALDGEQAHPLVAVSL